MSAVYHGQTGLPTLKELSRSYRTIHKALRRTINRLQTRTSGSIPGAGPQLYAPHQRPEMAAPQNARQRARSNFAPHAALREVIPDLLKKTFFDR